MTNILKYFIIFLIILFIFLFVCGNYKYKNIIIYIYHEYIKFMLYIYPYDDNSDNEIIKINFDNYKDIEVDDKSKNIYLITINNNISIDDFNEKLKNFNFNFIIYKFSTDQSLDGAQLWILETEVNETNEAFNKKIYFYFTYFFYFNLWILN